MESTLPASPASAVGSALSDDAKKIVLEQLKLYFDLYKHHWDLYLKAHVLFYAVVGALGGYLSKGELTSQERTLITAAIAVGAFVAAIASAVSLQWVKNIRNTTFTLEAQIGPLHYSFTGPERIVITLGVVSLGIALTAIGRLFW